MRDVEAVVEPPSIAEGCAVLCVDDEPRVLSALERTLRREPYELLRAGGGAEALELLGRHPIKVVVTDERMPGMSGSELLTRVGQIRPSIGRIILTGHPGPAVLIRSLEVGSDFLMTKPWDENRLRQAIRRLIYEVDRSRASDSAPPPEPWLDLGGEG
jgi:DNA-binding NtrC family response regulator